MITRPAWYLVNGSLFSPDAEIHISIEHEKLKSLPNMLITEPKLIAYLSKADEILMKGEELQIKQKGKKIEVYYGMNMGRKMSSEMVSLHTTLINNTKKPRGVDLSKLYEYIQKVDPATLTTIAISPSSVSFVSNGVVAMGTTSWLDFIPVDNIENTNIPGAPLYINKILPYCKEADDDIKIYQYDSQADSEITGTFEIQGMKATIRGILRPHFKLDAIPRIMTLYNAPAGEAIVTYPKDVYDEIAKALISETNVTIETDGRIVGHGDFASKGKTVKTEFKPSEPISLPILAFSYKLAKDEMFSIHKTTLPGAGKTTIVQAGKVRGYIKVG